MKLNINGKEVDLVVNGEKVDFAAKKAKLSDKKMSMDKIVKKAKEAAEAQEQLELKNE